MKEPTMKKTLLTAGVLTLLTAGAYAAQHTEDINITGNAKGLNTTALVSGSTGTAVSGTVPIGGSFCTWTSASDCTVKIRTQ